MSRRSAQSWIWCGTVWAFGWLVLPGVWAQDPPPVEFELVPKTLVRSGPAVGSLAVSPDARWAVLGQDDGRVLVRDLIENQVLHGLNAHEGGVSAVKFAPSGEYFATAGRDGRIRLWHGDSGRLQATLTGHENWITCLAFSPDGRTLATGGYDRTVRLWSVDAGVESKLFADLPATVRTVAFSPDGSTLVSAGDDGVVRFWNLKTAAQETPLPEQAGGIRAVAFSPDGKKLLTVPVEEKIRIWDLETNQADKEFSAVAPDESDTTPQTAEYCPDNLAVIVTTRGGRARIWSVKTGQLLQSLDGHEDAACALAISADGKTLYTAGRDGKFQAWPALLPLEPPLYKLPIATGDVWALSLSPDGKTLAVAGRGGFVELWDPTTGQRQRLLEGFEGTVDCVEFSRDGKLLAAAGWRSKQFLAWSTETGEVVHNLTLENNIQTFALSPEGHSLAAGHVKHSSVHIYSLPEGKKVQEITGHNLPVYDVAFSPDGTKVASSSGEWTERKPGRVMLHGALDGSKLAQFDDHTHAVRSLTFTPDGSRLFSLSQDGVLKAYKVAGLRESVSLKNGLDARPVASTADGGRVAVGLQNGNINVWDLQRREIEHRLQGTDDLFALEFSRDGSLLFGADGNEFVQIWKLSQGENTLAQTLHSWLSRPAIAQRPRDTNPKETP
jgi:WD40 repeat protein